jgi:hypothetical protein
MNDACLGGFKVEYGLALIQYIAKGDQVPFLSAQDIGRLAKSLGLLSPDVVTVHSAALASYVPQNEPNQVTAAAEFLVQSLQALELAWDLHRHQNLTRAANELQTPLATLRFAIQVGLGRVERGGTLDPITLHKALTQVDKLNPKIAELLSESDEVLTKRWSSFP